MSKDLVKKWEVTGLLDDFNGVYPSSKELREVRKKQTKKEILAEALEDCANKMLKDDNPDEDFYGMALPLIRRIYDMSNIMEHHYDETAGLVAEYKKMKELYFKLKDNKEFKPYYELKEYKVDIEVELCALIAEKYIEKYGETNEGECDDEAE